MAVQNEPIYLGDVLKYEAPNLFSRDKVTILGGSGAARPLTLGMVLGKITASGKYVQLAPAASDGSQNAAGVLVADVTAPDGVDVPGVVVTRHAIFETSNIVWPAGATTNQKNAAIAQLQALGILVRAGA